MSKKFYEFKNITPKSADLFIYGEIVDEKTQDFWTGEYSETEVGLMDFKEELDSIGNVSVLNLYINSPGGDVFTASTMISMLERKKSNGTVIKAFVDGLSASAASFLMMVADTIYLYKNSVVMVHKPMSYAVGNVIEMQKTIDALNKIEESVMLPMYMTKAKVSEQVIQDLIAQESWLSASDMEQYFNVQVLNEEKIAVTSISPELFKRYKNIPEFLKNSLKIKEKEEKVENNDIKLEKELKIRLNLVEYSLKIKERSEENEVQSFS